MHRNEGVIFFYGNSLFSRIRRKESVIIITMSRKCVFFCEYIFWGTLSSLFFSFLIFKNTFSSFFSLNYSFDFFSGLQYLFTFFLAHISAYFSISL